MMHVFVFLYDHNSYTATTTPTLTLSQNSQSMVGVSFVLDDARCVSNYSVNVTRGDGLTTSVSGTSSPLMVGGLDLCQYNYSFVGYTTSMTGEMSGVSAKVDLMIDLIGKQTVVKFVAFEFRPNSCE